jgi:hypothetical protein
MCCSCEAQLRNEVKYIPHFLDSLKYFELEGNNSRLSMKCKTWGPHSGVAEDSSILWYHAMLSVKLHTFQRNTVPFFQSQVAREILTPQHGITFFSVSKLKIIAYSHALGLEGEWQWADRKFSKWFWNHATAPSSSHRPSCTPCASQWCLL